MSEKFGGGKNGLLKDRINPTLARLNLEMQLKRQKLDYNLREPTEIQTISPLTEEDRFFEFVQIYGSKTGISASNMCAAFKPVAYHPYTGTLYLIATGHDGNFNSEKFNKPSEIETLAMGETIKLHDLGNHFYLIVPQKSKVIFEHGPEENGMNEIDLKSLIAQESYFKHINKKNI